MERRSSFFRGSELPRLLFLAAVMVVGWVLVWNYAQKLNQAAEQELTVKGKPEPVVADQSIEFETVTDRTPIEFRDNAAYALLLARARGRTPEELAAVARRDVVLAHLWEKPAALPRCTDPPAGHRPSSACATRRSSARTGGSTKHGSSRPEATSLPTCACLKNAPRACRSVPMSPSESSSTATS